MDIIKAFTLSLVVFLAVGCTSAPIKPVSLDEHFYKEKTQKVGIYLDTLPKVNTYFPGAGCLLCLAAAEIANSSVTDHVQALSIEDIDDIVADVESALDEKGLESVLVTKKMDLEKMSKFSAPDAGPDQVIQYARKDFRSLKSSLGVDKLVLIDINQVGVIRSYQSYIPTTGPMGYLYGEVAIIDLNDNSYKMYESVNIKTVVVGEWDEPTTFPGITTAFYEALNILKERVKTLMEPSDNTVAAVK